MMDGIRTFRQEFDGGMALQMMFVAANRDRAAEMAHLARGLEPGEIQLNTPLRPSPTSPLSRAEMAEVEATFAGLPAISVYTAQPPEANVLDEAEMRLRRPEKPSGRG